MTRRTRTAFLILGLVELLAALSVPGIFLWPLNAFRMSNYYSQDAILLVVGMDLLRVLYLVLPLAGLIGSMRNRTWSVYCLASFPLVAWVFGAGAVPYLSHVFRPVQPRLIAVTAINLAVIAAVLWFYRGRSNNSFKPNPLRGSA
jgi:hypothetical protein